MTYYRRCHPLSDRMNLNSHSRGRFFLACISLPRVSHRTSTLSLTSSIMLTRAPAHKVSLPSWMFALLPWRPVSTLPPSNASATVTVTELAFGTVTPSLPDSYRDFFPAHPKLTDSAGAPTR